MTIRRVRRALALPASAWCLAVEAMILLALSRTVLALLPFRTAMRWLGLRRRDGTWAGDDAADGASVAPVVPLVAAAVRRAASVAPFRAVCLQQAVAAALMLRRRGCAVQVHFGVAKDVHGGLIAHAWSASQGVLVTGGLQRPHYQPISVFVT